MHARRGFTLVEILIVLALVGVLSAMAVPRLLDRRVIDERAAADELRATLITARRVALAQEREVCVLVAPANVRVVHVSGGACDPAVPVQGSTGAMRLTAPNGSAGYTGDAVVRFTARGQLTPLVDRRVGIGTRLWLVERRTGAVS
jgi:prepilin-type N-terminal cleavage/methylation domain-containing protein